MSGHYWLAIFLYVSRYESAEEECEEMLMQEMEKHNVMLVLLTVQRTIRDSDRQGRNINVKAP